MVSSSASKEQPYEWQDGYGWRDVTAGAGPVINHAAVTALMRTDSDNDEIGGTVPFEEEGSSLDARLAPGIRSIFKFKI